MKILITDANPHNRKDLANFLIQNGFEIAGTAASGEETFEMALALPPDLIILDVNLPDMDALELTTRLAILRPSPAVILLTINHDPAVEWRGLQAGAFACLAKNAGIDPLIDAIQEIQSSY